ncbi:hypothetical protein MNB_SV-12-1820 [hydrothermal vent metagenome]|uniref:Lipoprotein n=1 Tax=hydrothermal vent metagenome TaxID=652676 RepID=A0A1W1B9P9_9ZZZZ
MKTNIRKTLILLNIFALSLFFQACGKDANNNSEQKPMAVGTATSISFSSKENSDMDKSDIEILTQRLGQILQKHIQTINNKEATIFTKQLNYCELGGSINVANYGKVQNHTKAISFNLCKDDEIIQNGNIELSYYNANEDGKFPELLNIVVQKPYFFNDLNLTKDTKIQVSNIVYSNSKVLSFETSTTGRIIIDKRKVFNLQNFEQRIKL